MKCPYCGEEINNNATKCRFCHEWLNKDSQIVCPSCAEQIPSNVNKCPACGESLKKNFFSKKYLIICGITIIVLLLITIGTTYKLNLDQSAIKDSGIGVAIGNSCNVVVVNRVLPDMPAYEAGIEVGDTIIKVNNKYVFDVNTAVNMMRGKSGTSLKVTVLHNSTPKTYKLVRKYLSE